jgi:hypothetical protein
MHKKGLKIGYRTKIRLRLARPSVRKKKDRSGFEGVGSPTEGSFCPRGLELERKVKATVTTLTLSIPLRAMVSNHMARLIFK